MNIEGVQTFASSTVERPVERDVKVAQSESFIETTAQTASSQAEATKDLQASSSEEQEVKESDLKASVKRANDFMDAMNKDLQFELDERLENNQVVVKVIERESGDVVRQYPAEEMIEIMGRLEETILGVLVDDQA